MKPVFLIIALFFMGNLNAQVVLNLDYKSIDNSKSNSLGINAQYLFGQSATSFPAVSSGVYLNRSSSKNYSIHVPVNLHYRLFLIGAQSCCGGLYSEIMGGANFKVHDLSDSRIEDFNTVTPELSLGLGGYFSRGLDVNLRVGGTYLTKEVKPFIGARVGLLL